MPDRAETERRYTSSSEAIRNLISELAADGVSQGELAAALIVVATQVMQAASSPEETAGWLADVTVAYGSFIQH